MCVVSPSVRCTFHLIYSQTLKCQIMIAIKWQAQTRALCPPWTARLKWCLEVILISYVCVVVETSFLSKSIDSCHCISFFSPSVLQLKKTKLALLTQISGCIIKFSCHCHHLDKPTKTQSRCLALHTVYSLKCCQCAENVS